MPFMIRTWHLLDLGQWPETVQVLEETVGINDHWPARKSARPSRGTTSQEELTFSVEFTFCRHFFTYDLLAEQNRRVFCVCSV